MNKKNPLKFTLTYNKTEVCLKLCDKTLEVLNSLSIKTDKIDFDFMNYYDKRYLIKNDLKRKIDTSSFLFFSVELLKKGNIKFNIRCIHDLDYFKKVFQRDLKTIFNYYLLYGGVC